MKYKRISNRLGEVLNSKNFGDFEIISTSANRRTLVRFINTGAVAEFSNDNIIRGNIKDPSVENKIYDWGVNDAEYKVYKTGKINGKIYNVWVCPIYQDWLGILERGFCPRYKEKYPSYKDTKVCEEWKYFSNFRRWVLEEQPNKNWENCVPDKDLLSCNQSIYSPDTVVYIDCKLNSFILARGNDRGAYMLGVSMYPSGRFRAAVSDPFLAKQVHIKVYDTELEAHKAWQAKKHEYACILADEQTDPRVAKALRERYTPDKDWTCA